MQNYLQSEFSAINILIYILSTYTENENFSKID